MRFRPRFPVRCARFQKTRASAPKPGRRGQITGASGLLELQAKTRQMQRPQIAAAALEAVRRLPNLVGVAPGNGLIKHFQALPAVAHKGFHQSLKAFPAHHGLQFLNSILIQCRVGHGNAPRPVPIVLFRAKYQDRYHGVQESAAAVIQPPPAAVAAAAADASRPRHPGPSAAPAAPPGRAL